MAPPVQSTVTADGILLLTIDRPPVNALSQDLLAALDAALGDFEARPALRALLLTGAGRCFMAGADIAEFEAPQYDLAPLHRFYRRLEDQPRPVAVYWHGSTLGAGVELGLAAHHRLAAPDARLGLPEVQLGLLPGGQGTQRLPRLVGVPMALRLMLDGQPVDAQTAQQIGLVDRLVDQAVNAPEGTAALAGLRALLAEGAGPRPTRLRPLQATAAQAAIVDCLQAGLALPFEQACATEARAFEALRTSAESRAARAAFFARRRRRET